jgi:peptidoglycan/LPS O-acetylase OafA/YrhL
MKPPRNQTGSLHHSQAVARQMPAAHLPNYTSFLDGLRGLAALYVLMHHARYVLHEGYSDGYLKHPESYSAIGRATLYAFSVFRWGHEAVLFFFVLSGFVIHLRYARQRITNPLAPFDLGDFLRRRLRRLYPPLVGALVVTFAVDSVGKAMQLPIYGGDTPYRLINAWVHPDLGVRTLAGNLAFLMECYVPCYGTNSPLWSLKYEWWFYVVYPGVWLVARKSVAGATMLIAGLRMLSLLPELWPIRLAQQVFSMLLVWWMGALVAEAYARGMKRTLSILGTAALAIPIMLLLKHRFPIPVEAFGFAFAGVIAGGLRWRMSGRPLRLLDRLSWLGDMSYSLYVSHMPLLYLGGGILMAGSAVGRLPQGFGPLAGGVMVCMLFAYVMHLVVERPFMGLKRGG